MLVFWNKQLVLPVFLLIPQVFIVLGMMVGCGRQNGVF